MRHIRTVCHLQTPVTLCQVHSGTGSLIVAVERNLLVWTITGRLVGISEHQISHGNVVRVDVPKLTCATYSCGDDWDDDNVFVTGHVDGTIRFWSVICDETRTVSISDVITGRRMRLRTIKVFQ